MANVRDALVVTLVSEWRFRRWQSSNWCGCWATSSVGEYGLRYGLSRRAAKSGRTPCTELVRDLDVRKGLPLSAEAAHGCFSAQINEDVTPSAAEGGVRRRGLGDSDIPRWPEFQLEIRDCVPIKPHSLVVEARKAAEPNMGPLTFSA